PFVYSELAIGRAVALGVIVPFLARIVDDFSITDVADVVFIEVQLEAGQHSKAMKKMVLAAIESRRYPASVEGIDDVVPRDAVVTSLENPVQ
ncbi:hypothetical protein AAVH_37948, partial [Aphelenchoides avenae]